jgi:hypothetical protein
MVSEYDLEQRRIINYLRKVNNKDHHHTRRRIIALFYETTYATIPINRKLETTDSNKILHEDFPEYFHLKTREEILELYNKEVSPKKIIVYPYDLNDYDIKEDTHLEISPKTFRPVYHENWREQAEVVNGTSFKNQHSFYNDYLKFYIQNNEFPTYLQFLKFLYFKYKKPLHKDIKIVFDNIEKSYNPIKEFIKTNNLSFKEIKAILIQSASITNRIKLQQSLPYQ